MLDERIVKSFYVRKISMLDNSSGDQWYEPVYTQVFHWNLSQKRDSQRGDIHPNYCRERFVHTPHLYDCTLRSCVTH